VPVHAYIGTHVELASCLKLSVSTLNIAVKNCKEMEDRSCVDHTPDSGNYCELEFVLDPWFKQAYESNISIDGTHIKKKSLQITTHFGMANFPASNGWIDEFKRIQNIVYRTLSDDRVLKVKLK
jgi:hypothetical protein